MTGDSGEGGVVAMTYRELATRLGIRPASAKARALRNRWRTTPGNDGLARVSVPAEVLDAAKDEADSTPPPPSAPEPTPPPAAGPDMLDALFRQLAAADDRHAAEMQRAQQRHDAEMARMRDAHNDLVKAHDDELARMQHIHVVEMMRLERLLSEARRPWWVRWIGIRE